MNYLVHLYLSDPDPDCLLGTLMGDFVKGPLGESWPAGIRRGLELHRKVDVFAHHSPAFRRSKRRIDERFGHLRPVMIDIFYDHFLARDWDLHSADPLEPWSQRIYRLLEENMTRLPDGLRSVAPRMIAHDWLGSYRDLEVIGLVLERLSRRLRRPNSLGEGLPELQRNYVGLRGDFGEFLAEARTFVRQEGTG